MFKFTKKTNKEKAYSRDFIHNSIAAQIYALTDIYGGQPTGTDAESVSKELRFQEPLTVLLSNNRQIRLSSVRILKDNKMLMIPLANGETMMTFDMLKLQIEPTIEGASWNHDMQSFRTSELEAILKAIIEDLITQKKS